VLAGPPGLAAAAVRSSCSNMANRCRPSVDLGAPRWFGSSGCRLPRRQPCPRRHLDQFNGLTTREKLYETADRGLRCPTAQSA